MLSVFLLLLLLSCQSLSKYVSDVYPTLVPKYEIRVDFFTNKTVTSGLIHTLPQKSKLAEFKQHLQCPLSQSNFNYNNGMVDMMRRMSLSSHTFKLACAFIESAGEETGVCRTGIECLARLKKYESGNFVKGENFNRISNWARARLYRVVNGELKMDWPWGLDRFDDLRKGVLGDTVIPLLKMTLDRISDVKDSVFFTGGDTPGLPFNIPVPIFGHSTSDPYAEMVWPWYEMWQDANQVYKKLRKLNLPFTEPSYMLTESGYRSWKKRVPKAAYFATNQGMIRQFMFDVARLHPELLDARFPEDRLPLRNWHPLSTEDSLSSDEKFALIHDVEAVEAARLQPAGFGLPLVNLSTTEFTKYYPGSYKYVVVPLSDGLATSSRLQHLLTHSGAVMLIQRSRTKFHISAEFKPWVHYVPLSYSGADIGEKVRWLRDHDDLARQIAENGRNFARSYLRLEDFYCYAASALEMLGEVTGGDSSDAASSVWNPVDLPPLAIHFYDTAAYEYPT